MILLTCISTREKNHVCISLFAHALWLMMLCLHGKVFMLFVLEGNCYAALRA